MLAFPPDHVLAVELELVGPVLDVVQGFVVVHVALARVAPDAQIGEAEAKGMTALGCVYHHVLLHVAAAAHGMAAEAQPLLFFLLAVGASQGEDIGVGELHAGDLVEMRTPGQRHHQLGVSVLRQGQEL